MLIWASVYDLLHRAVVLECSILRHPLHIHLFAKELLAAVMESVLIGEHWGHVLEFRIH